MSDLHSSISQYEKSIWWVFDLRNLHKFLPILLVKNCPIPILILSTEISFTIISWRILSILITFYGCLGLNYENYLYMVFPIRDMKQFAYISIDCLSLVCIKSTINFRVVLRFYFPAYCFVKSSEIAYIKEWYIWYT